MDNYYFRMKVGRGNGLFFPCLASSYIRSGGALSSKSDFKQVKLELEKYLLTNPVIDLYVGYSCDQGTLELDSSNKIAVKKLPTCADTKFKESDFKYHHTRKDFYYFSYVTKNKDKCRIIIFTDKYLVITAPTGIWQQIPIDSSFGPYELTSRIDDLGVDTGKGTSSGKRWESIHENAMLQVQVLKVLERDKILPSLDSLAVYQFLSQGTLRPFFAIGQSRETEIRNILDYPKVQKDLLKRIEVKSSGVNGYVAEISEEGAEYLFGYFYRLILNQTIDPSNRLIVGAKMRAQIAYVLISPVQLEAAAAIFLRDIGFMPDFYVANSKDYIDVRARKIAQLKMTARQSDLIQKLALKIPGNIITVQCKDYEKSQNTDANIVFQPLPEEKSFNDKTQILSLKEVLNAMDEVCPLKNGKPVKDGEIFDLQIWWHNHTQLIEELNFKVLPKLDDTSFRKALKDQMHVHGFDPQVVPEWAIEQAIDTIIIENLFNDSSSWGHHGLKYKYKLEQFQREDLLQKYQEGLKDNSHYWWYKKFKVIDNDLIYSLSVECAPLDPLS